MSTNFSITSLRTNTLNTISGSDISLSSKNLTSGIDITVSGTVRGLHIWTSLLKNGGLGIQFNNENISQIGSITVPIASGLVYSGTTTASAASNSLTLNSKVGTATFTGQTCANGATLTLTINNTTTGTNGIVSFSCNVSEATATALYIKSVTYNASTSIVVVIANAGAASTGAVTFVIYFQNFN